MNPTNGDRITIIYDGHCPVCDAYFRMQRLRESGIDAELVDARTRPDLVREFAARGIDLDRDFVLRLGDAEYVGGDAMFVLASLSGRANLLRRASLRLFRHRRVANALYPALRAGRRLLLFLLGRKALTAV